MKCFSKQSATNNKQQAIAPPSLTPEFLTTTEIPNKKPPIQPDFQGLSRQLCLPIQAKLNVSEPSDIYEQEADRVAAQISQTLQTQNTDNTPIDVNDSAPKISTLRRSPVQPIQRDIETGSNPQSSPLETSISRSLGGGSPLPKTLQPRLENAFGRSLDHVRIHNDARANRFNRSLHSRAFTTGHNIFFKQGEYQPTTPKGQNLLAHELTHTFQQDNYAGQFNTHNFIQRAIPSLNIQVQPNEAQLLTNIRTAITNYNNIANQRSTAQQYQRCFNRLQRVDRAIYAWFTDISINRTRFNEDPDAQEVQRISTAATREHESLIHASKNLINVLPFDTHGMQPNDVTALRGLWQSIVNNRGKIQLIGSNQYNRRVLAELAKLLSTPTGRSMLLFLNTPAPNEIVGSTAAALSSIYIGENLEQLSQTVRRASPQLHNEEKSESQPLNIDDNNNRKLSDMTEISESDIDLSSPPNPNNFPAITALTKHLIRDAALAGRSGFTHGGKKYTFNTRGTGSFVTSYPGVSTSAGKVHGHQIFHPAWITLGHELGHSVNMKAGSTSLDFSHFDSLTRSLAGGVDQSAKWDNAEELLTIENYENALRSESGMTERDGHRTAQWATQYGLQFRTRLQRRLNIFITTFNDNTWTTDTDFRPLMTRCRRVRANQALDPTYRAQIQQDITNFIANQINNVLPTYLRAISDSHTKAQVLNQELPTPQEKLRALLYLHKYRAYFRQIKQRLHDDARKRIGFNRTKPNQTQRALQRKASFLNLIRYEVRFP